MSHIEKERRRLHVETTNNVTTGKEAGTSVSQPQTSLPTCTTSQNLGDESKSFVCC